MARTQIHPKKFGLALSLPPPAAGVQDAIEELGVSVVREPDSGRTYAIVKITTEAGVAGYGEAAGNPPDVVARFRRAREVVRGQDALAAAAVDVALKGKLAGAGVRGAFNTALLDILGKTVQAPLYETLGGPTREKIRAMAAVAGETAAEVRAGATRAHAAGFRAFSIPLHLPGGEARGRAFYREVRNQLDTLRADLGEDADFVLDCGGRTTAAEGLSLAAVFEDFHLLWLDEPASDVSAEALASVSNGSVTPVGYGRSLVGNAGFQDLLRLDGIDVLRPGISDSGITSTRKAAALAEVYYVAIAPYHRGGPIATAAALHTASSLPNFFIQEVPFSSSERDRKMRNEIAGRSIEQPRDGFFPLPPGPGLGVAVSEDALSKYGIAA